MATPLPEILDEVLESSFINGLKAPIRAEIRMMKPRGLGHIMGLAQRVVELPINRLWVPQLPEL